MRGEILPGVRLFQVKEKKRNPAVTVSKFLPLAEPGCEFLGEQKAAKKPKDVACIFSGECLGSAVTQRRHEYRIQLHPGQRDLAQVRGRG
jgi:hypothetical protein